MSKPVHPIRKMRVALEQAGAAMPFDPTDVEPVLARQLKPLLDLAERALNHSRGQRKDGAVWPPCDCDDCHLLARWRAKL